MEKVEDGFGGARRTTTIEDGGMRKIAVIVVHGIGEQKRFEFLESVATNIYKAAKDLGRKNVHISVRHGDQTPHSSPEPSWRSAPVEVRWTEDGGEEALLSFREVHWADLDNKASFVRFLKLFGWVLGMSGARTYRIGRVGAATANGMCAPQSTSLWQAFTTRLALFATSVAFLLLIATVGSIYWLLRRLSFEASFLRNIIGLIYDYLGDVKLYQDWFDRKDDRAETVGEKSRVAIRRRMIRTLVETAVEVASDDWDGYYVIAHSLGTVVSFNGLMETAVSLPNYLNQEEWDALPDAFKLVVQCEIPKRQMPVRPPWLDLGYPEDKHDTIPRQSLFGKLLGYVTLGSPLDKYAAIWPAIVPVNANQMRDTAVPWINVADRQDIVAGKLDQYRGCDGASTIGGLELQNHVWADQWIFALAHTSYWTANESGDRLAGRLVMLLGGGAFVPPKNRMPAWLANLVYRISLIGVVILMAWAVTAGLNLLYGWLEVNREGTIMGTLVVAGVIVGIAAVVRRLFELYKFRPKKS